MNFTIEGPLPDPTDDCERILRALPEFHRSGIGGGLMENAEKYAKSQKVEYLQVKTLGPPSDDVNYAKTRAFYLALGFRPLEEFRQIWDENHPCLILVKKI
jgi:GNAT superfamily N-acetyltransferase